LPRRVVEHLIDAGEEGGVEREGAGLLGVPAEPDRDGHVIEAARRAQRHVTVSRPSAVRQPAPHHSSAR
jgi:hypothetical protein